MATPRILIVEDDLISARIIREQLCTLGYRTVGLTPLDEDGLRLAVEIKPDLVLMDITLDGAHSECATEEILETDCPGPAEPMTCAAGG